MPDPKASRAEDAIDRHVSEQVRKLRHMQRLSQSDIAKLLGVTFQQVQKFERGHNRIGAGRLYLLSHAFGVPITYFYAGLDTTGNKSADIKAVDNMLNSPEGRQIAKSFTMVRSAKGRKVLKDLFDVFAELPEDKKI